MKMPHDELNELRVQNKMMRDFLEQLVDQRYGIWSSFISKIKDFLKGTK